MDALSVRKGSVLIGWLKGRIAEKYAGGVLVDVGGVGYLVGVSANTWIELPPVDDTVELRIFTQAQENKLALYGFLTKEERRLFDLLITVKNVGPSSAMGMLSGGATPTTLARMISDKEVKQLVKLKGVGKKTAEMLVVELHEKCSKLLLDWGQGGATTAGTPKISQNAVQEEVTQALTQLGWKPAEASKIVSELNYDEGASTEEVLRLALRAMQR